MNIVEYFIEAAIKHPDNVAIIHGNGSVTYKELHEKVLKTVTYFSNKGVQSGDRVLVFVPMSIELYRSLLALFYMGSTVVFLDEWVSKERMEMCCRIANCKALIGNLKVRGFSYLSKELRSIPIKLKVAENSFTTIPPVFKPGKEHAALITFTTGSTGRPKAALRTHNFLHEQYKALLDYIHPKQNDFDITTLPIVLLLNLGVGATSVISGFKAKNPEKTNYKKVVNDIQIHKVNRISASPFFVEELAKYTLANTIELLTIEEIFTGGAPVFPDIAKTIKKGFSHTEVHVFFGSTEAEPISHCKAEDIIGDEKNMIGKGLLAGQPYTKMEVAILKRSEDSIQVHDEAELTSMLCKTSETGEIIVSGNHVLTQYFNSDDAFVKNKIVVGNKIWHRTGDAGYFDEDKKLYLIGRVNRLIEKGDQLISPFIYEYQLKQIEGIHIGTVLETRKQINIVIEMETGFTIESIRNEIRRCNLVMDELMVVKKIPRDPRHHSKIDYEKLKEQLMILDMAR